MAIGVMMTMRMMGMVELMVALRVVAAMMMMMMMMMMMRTTTTMTTTTI